MTSATIIRSASPEEAEALQTLITAHEQEGHLLPRTLSDLRVHAPRFLVAVDGETGGAGIVACGELAPLGHDVAEIRSLVVDRAYRGAGLGSRLVEALERRARLHGYHRLCAFTHRPDHFLKLGFSMVPHAWLPEKIAVDCHTCPLFRRCGQHAMLRTLTASRGRESFSAGRAREKDSRPLISARAAR
jgi:amino-acid N-acetyltransferase